MATHQDVARRPSGDAQGPSQGRLEQKQELGLVLAPAADIFEDGDGIGIVLDMPGVTKDRLIVKSDRNELVIEAEASIDMPAAMQSAYAEVRSARYRRTFALTNELDAGSVEASMKNGVLSIRIPKRAELKPRRIDIQTA